MIETDPITESFLLSAGFERCNNSFEKMSTCDGPVFHLCISLLSGCDGCVVKQVDSKLNEQCVYLRMPESIQELLDLCRVLGVETQVDFLMAYTDYPIIELGDVGGCVAPIRQAKVLSYDDHKYCYVEVEGVRTEIKWGYLYVEPGRSGNAKTIDPRVLKVEPFPDLESKDE